MAWIKRNLLLVISGVIALALLGVGIWYLMSARAKNAQIDQDLGQAKSELDTLMAQKPFPSSSNIAQARRELDRVKTFAADASKLFPHTPPPPQLNNLSFKVLLQTTVNELNTEAASVGVRVETNYYYSFEAERLPVNFPPESLVPLADRLGDIKEVASLMFKAKVNRLVSVRRAAVPGETIVGNDYLPEGPRHHDEAGVVMWPYEFTFESFSPELATVMEQLAQTKQAWVVRSLTVDPAEGAATKGQSPTPAPAAPTGAPVGRRGAQPAAAAAPKTGPETFLNEHTLRVVMKLDVIKSAK